MPILSKLFGKKDKKEKKPAVSKEKIIPVKETPKIAPTKTAEFKSGDVLLSPVTTEKAVSGQSLSPYGRSPAGRNKYVFKVARKSNKIDIIKAVSKAYNVKAISANIINIPRKARQVGKTKGFKSGYKKAVVTLVKGQTIEIK